MKKSKEQREPTPEMCRRKFTDKQITDAVTAMKPTSEWPVVQEARRIAAKQFEHYNEMMGAKMAKESKTEKKLFVVDTIVTFRHKYVIEADELEHAYDEVTMRDSGSPADEFDEVTQLYLGETITDGREISKKEFKKMLKGLEADNREISSYWMGDKLIRKIDYDRD
jgi:hypothetical protein